jgi:hypothetical protein
LLALVLVSLPVFAGCGSPNKGSPEVNRCVAPGRMFAAYTRGNPPVFAVRSSRHFCSGGRSVWYYVTKYAEAEIADRQGTI